MGSASAHTDSRTRFAAAMVCWAKREPLRTSKESSFLAGDRNSVADQICRLHLRPLGDSLATSTLATEELRTTPSFRCTELDIYLQPSNLCLRLSACLNVWTKNVVAPRAWLTHPAHWKQDMSIGLAHARVWAHLRNHSRLKSAVVIWLSPWLWRCWWLTKLSLLQSGRSS